MSNSSTTISTTHTLWLRLTENNPMLDLEFDVPLTPRANPENIRHNRNSHRGDPNLHLQPKTRNLTRPGHYSSNPSFPSIFEASKLLPFLPSDLADRHFNFPAIRIPTMRTNKGKPIVYPITRWRPRKERSLPARAFHIPAYVSFPDQKKQMTPGAHQERTRRPRR